MISRLLILLCFVTSVAFAAEPYADVLSEAWRARLADLAQPKSLSAAFTESRHTPLKRQPVVVNGVVRIDRERGLSLSYDQRNAPVVILDKQGLLLRHANGREQSAPPDAETDLRLLHALFAFDLPTLANAYDLAVNGAPDADWTLIFARRPDSTASYRELILTGSAGHLTGITLAKTANLKTVIALEPPQLVPAFPPEDLARFFR